MKLLNLSALLVALLFAAFQTPASVITDVEEINQRVGGLIGDADGIRPNIQKLSWVHDLSDTSFFLGKATSASLTIELFDDESDVLVQFERASIVIGILDFIDDSLIYKPDADWSSALGINSLVALNTTGRLSVQVSSVLWTDFVIGDSILEVSTIPEPGAVVILSLGLVALATIRRQRTVK
ncbi:MAG: PEP-CTERM sorting domain-containing protein [Candidatus Thiodiazotropha sp.]